VGVEFARNDGAAGITDGAGGAEPGSTRASTRASTGDAPEFRTTVRRGTPVVTVTGPPAELTLWATGRTTAAKVRLDGTEAGTAMLAQARWRL